MPFGFSPNPNCLSPEGRVSVNGVRDLPQGTDWKKIVVPAGTLNNFNDVAACYNAIMLRAFGLDKEATHPDKGCCPFAVVVGKCFGVKSKKPGEPDKPCIKCANKHLLATGKLKPIVSIVKAGASVDTLPKLKGDG